MRAQGTGSIWTAKRSGYEAWVGQVWVNGKQHQKTLGRKRRAGSTDGLTRAMAERALRAYRSEVEEKAKEQAVRGPRDEARLSVVAERHFNGLERDGLRRTTLAAYRSILAEHLVPYFGDVPIDEITTPDIEAFSEHQAEAMGLAATTIDNHLAPLSGVFRFAMRKGIVTANPVSAAKRVRRRKVDKNISFLTAEEVEAVVRAARGVADEVRGETDAALIFTAAWTGLRRGEIIALRWRDVDWTAGLIRVERARNNQGDTTDPKSETSKRSVPMDDEVAGVLDRHFKRSRYQGDEDLVFCHPHTGRYYNPDSLTNRFKKALTRAGVQRIRFHDLRHTYGTLMASAGIPMVALMTFMGHSDVQTTMIYARWAPDPLNGRDWVRRARENSLRNSTRGTEVTTPA
jgi:integrase